MPLDHFPLLEADREGWRVAHPLPEVLVLVVCGTIGPCDDFDEIIEWGEDNLPFLWRLLRHRQGIAGSPQALAEAVRSHWAIENSLRRVLNVAFGRDKAIPCRPRTRQHGDRPTLRLRAVDDNQGVKLRRNEAARSPNT